MNKSKKGLISLIIIIAVLVLAFLFIPAGKLQIGNNVIYGDYYDTAYDAYLHNDESVVIKKEIATVDVTDNCAVWLAETDENEMYVSLMDIKDGKYCILGNAYFYHYDTSDFKSANISLDSDFQAKNDIIKWDILPESVYEKSNLKDNAQCSAVKIKARDVDGNEVDSLFVYQVEEKNQ